MISQTSGTLFANQPRIKRLSNGYPSFFGFSLLPRIQSTREMQNGDVGVRNYISPGPVAVFTHISLKSFMQCFSSSTRYVIKLIWRSFCSKAVKIATFRMILQGKQSSQSTLDCAFSSVIFKLLKIFLLMCEILENRTNERTKRNPANKLLF